MNILSFTLWMLFSFKDCLYSCIAHTLINTDYRFRNRMVKYIAGRIKSHHAAHCQTLHASIQGTDSIGKFFWEHWNYPVSKIDTCRSL